MSGRVNGVVALGAKSGGALVAIGNFDGVHLGHQAVVRSAVQDAKRKSLEPLVLTFDPHPAEVLGHGRPPMLTTPDRRVELLCALSPDLTVVVEPFTLELAATPAANFAKELIADHLGAEEVVVGENFRFGQGRKGDLALLRALGKQLGFRAVAQEIVSDAGGAFSSTRIRDAVLRGELAHAEALLGRPHAISGVVVQGAQRGRVLGFPTANVSGVPEVCPPHGVYACQVERLGDGGPVLLGGGALNIGVRPTVTGGLSTEVHLLDFSGDLYGQNLRVHLIERLRPEQKFSGLDALKAQIAKDVIQCRSILSGRRPSA